MSHRRLITIRRTVPPEFLQRYETGWSEVRRLAAGSEVRAWRFSAAEEPSAFIEFLEFGGGSDPRDQAELAGALKYLDGLARGTTEEWKEAQ